MMQLLETGQRNELKQLVENVKELLESAFTKKLLDYGIQASSKNLLPLLKLSEYGILSDDAVQEKQEFVKIQKELHESILQELPLLDNWEECYTWYLDKVIYTFFNRIFAVRVMEELGLLEESTLIPQPDLGNISARMNKIQQTYPDQYASWHRLVLENFFNEISKEINVLFDPTDPLMKIWPNSDVIEIVIQKLNELPHEIYLAEDVIGWFYHYYVLKFRKSYKTMSGQREKESKGKKKQGKSPKNPYFLSVLNTVYTPRWMVRVLVDNSLGHWWADVNPSSRIFYESPFYIQKEPVHLETATKDVQKLQILDPACGSGNFLVYAFKCLVEIYREQYPQWSYSQIISSILSKNLFGVDINRRPAQLSALSLFILAKRTLKENAPVELSSFYIPSLNVVCCDIRIPESTQKTLMLQKISPELKKILKDILDLFNNADQLGSLIDLRSLQETLDKLKKGNMDAVLTSSKSNGGELFDISKFIDQILQDNVQNIGLQLFGKQTKNALNLAGLLLKRYDIILGNPPFGLMIDITKDYLKNQYPNSGNDLISAFVDQSLRLLKKNGYIAMVSDFSFLHQFPTKRQNAPTPL